MVTALKISPGQNPTPCFLCDNRDYLNRCVSPDPYLVYTASALKIEENIAAIYCQNGYLFSLPGNRRVGDRIICGVFYIVRVKDGNLMSLTDHDIVKYSLLYWDAESFGKDELEDSILDASG